MGEGPIARRKLLLSTGASAGAFRRWGLPLVLFILTVLTTWEALGVAFSVTLMSILVCHEMGHYLVARYHGVPASLPHFIPIPPPFNQLFLLGTLGAVIGMRTDQADRNQLLDIGAAGPVAGFLVAVPAMALGIHWSTVVELKAAGPTLFFGDSLLSALLLQWTGPSLAPGQDLMAHPVLIGAWAGFLVTAINLLPMGQLDGGHVLHAVTPNRSRSWMTWVYRGLMLLGAAAVLVHLPETLVRAELVDKSMFAGWVEATQPLHRWLSGAFIVWALFGRMTGLRHPPVRDEYRPLTRSRRILAAGCGLVLILTFMPNPAWVEDLGDSLPVPAAQGGPAK
jgi:membrane-associated protease RseP (regulator of RpoE activity)